MVNGHDHNDDGDNDAFIRYMQINFLINGKTFTPWNLLVHINNMSILSANNNIVYFVFYFFDLFICSLYTNTYLFN